MPSQFFSITNTDGTEKPVALRAVMAGWHHRPTLKGEKMSFYEKAGAIIGLVMLALGIFLHYKYGRD